MAIFLNKYRPKVLDDIIGHEYIIRSVKTQLELERWSLPHYCFYGPPGSGKTTMAQCLARELYGDEWERIVLYINASEESGIDTVRNSIKKYGRTSSSIFDVPRKMIILDEFDHFNRQHAQPALRRPMEEYNENVLFVITCNFIHRVIEPIRSRCPLFRFRRAKTEEVIKYLERIRDGESLLVNDDVLEVIAENSRGDFRRATHIIESSILVDKTKKIVDMETVRNIFNFVDKDAIQKIYELITDGDSQTAIREIDSYLASGVLPETIVQELFELIQWQGRMNPEIAKLFSDISSDITTSAIPYIVFAYFVEKLRSLLNNEE